MAVGGIAVGALLGVTGFQLSAGLRGGELPIEQDPLPLSGAEAAPIGFLSDGPRTRPKAPLTSNSARREAGNGSAAARKPANAEPSPETAADGGTQAVATDAGSSPGAGP
jgi:hypothetical protein